MPVTRYVIPFTLGAAAGVLLHKNWPTIKLLAAPAARKALEGGTRLIAKTREAFWESSEKFSDLVAEIREEEELKAKGSVAGGSSSGEMGARGS